MLLAGQFPFSGRVAERPCLFVHVRTAVEELHRGDCGGLVFAGFALLWGLVDLLRRDQGNRRAIVHVIMLLAAWIAGFVNALVHAKDAWASMPTALILSAIGTVLAISAVWLRLSSPERGGSQ